MKVQDNEDKIILKIEQSKILIFIYISMFVFLFFYQFFKQPYSRDFIDLISFDLSLNMLSIQSISEVIIKQCIFAILISLSFAFLNMSLKYKIINVFFIILYSKIFLLISKKGLFDIKIILLLMIVSSVVLLITDKLIKFIKNNLN